MDIVERLLDYPNNRGHMFMRKAAANEILHWRGMTKGRESEIDKHLAEIERLTAQNKRLMSRGIEDMKDEIERLRAALWDILRPDNGMKNGGIMCRAIARLALEQSEKE